MGTVTHAVPIAHVDAVVDAFTVSRLPAGSRHPVWRCSVPPGVAVTRGVSVRDSDAVGERPQLRAGQRALPAQQLRHDRADVDVEPQVVG